MPKARRFLIRLDGPKYLIFHKSATPIEECSLYTENEVKDSISRRRSSPILRKVSGAYELVERPDLVKGKKKGKR